MISSSLPTIWFNAWKFDQEEMLWAAMALTVIEGLKKRYGPLQRVLFWFRLTRKRFSPLRAIWIVILDVLMPIILLLAALSVNVGTIGSKDSNSSGVLKEVLLQIKDFISLTPIQPIISDNPWIWNLIFFIGALVWGFKQYSSILRNPFQISAKSLVDKPNYEEKIGFIGSFQKDFEAIVSIATRPLIGWKPAKLVIFIDDLDRCKPPKAADIILAINQFLDSPGCVFVIGMDSTAVVASIEIKYKALFKKIKEENMEVVSPGRLFLDKIVQINFHIPKTTKESLNELAQAIISSKKIKSNLSNRDSSAIAVPETQPSSVPKNLDSNSEPSNEATQPIAASESIDKSTIEAAFEGSMRKLDKAFQNDLVGTQDIASYSSDDVSQSILTGTSLLQNNPRQLKRFINQFRLMVYICHEKGLFRRKIVANVEGEWLSLERLAIWVAWSIRWPELAKELFDGGWQKEIRGYLHKISGELSNDGSRNDTANWNKLRQDLIDSRSNINKIEYTNHWLFLPWDRWLEDNSFQKSIRQLGCFWEPSNEGAVSDDGNEDMLELMLTMSSSLRSIAEPTPSIRNELIDKLINNPSVQSRINNVLTSTIDGMQNQIGQAYGFYVKKADQNKGTIEGGKLLQLNNIPYDQNSCFTGRQQLLGNLRAYLTTKKNSILKSVVFGQPGVGKTQLVLEYCYRYKYDYGVVWWIKSEKPDDLAKDYAKLSVHLELQEKDSKDLDIQVEAVKRWLEMNPGWLLIFDNAETPEDLERYLGTI